LTGFCFLYIWDKSHSTTGNRKMTYEQLLIAISEKRQGNNNITIEIDGEFYQGKFRIVFDDDRLDDGHMVLTIKDCRGFGHFAAIK